MKRKWGYHPRGEGGAIIAAATAGVILGFVFGGGMKARKAKTQPYTLYMDVNGSQLSGNLINIINQANRSGDKVSTYGMSVSGYLARENALACRLILQQMYGGVWYVYLQGNQYNVLPQSRVTYLKSIGGSLGVEIA